MSCDVTSQQNALHEIGEMQRCSDMVYRMLTKTVDQERENLARGITQMLLEYSTHPEVKRLGDSITGDHAGLIQKVLIIAAISHDPDFLQYLMNHDSSCTSTLSQYSVDVAPPIIERLLDGDITLDDFVAAAVHAYTSL